MPVDVKMTTWSKLKVYKRQRTKAYKDFLQIVKWTLSSGCFSDDGPRFQGSSQNKILEGSNCAVLSLVVISDVVIFA